MSLLVVVLVDGGRGLSPTADALRSLPVGVVDEVCFLAVGPGPKLSERLADLVAADDCWRVLTVVRRQRTQGVLEIVHRSASTSVAVIASGTTVIAAGLARVRRLAEESAGSVVVGRHSGAQLSGLLRDQDDLADPPSAPVPLVVGPVELARRVAVPDEGGSAESWLSDWQASMLEHSRVVAGVVERPAVSGARLAAPEWLHPLASRACWDAGVLELEVSCASAPSTGQPSLATWRMLAVRSSDGDEVALASSVVGHEGGRDVAASLDVASLPEGVWRPAVEMLDPSAHGRGWLRNEILPDLVVHGRPVAVTRQGDYLELQVGVVRRPILHVDQDAQPVRLGDGRLRLRLAHLELVGPEPVHAWVEWAGERLRAEVVVHDGEAHLELDEPSGAGSAPVLVQFGTRRPSDTAAVLTRWADGEVALGPSGDATPPRWP